MAELLTAESLLALLTLVALEVVLGIDNLVFLSILTGKLPRERQKSARRIGLALAMGMRIALLLALGWIMRLTATLFTLWEHAVSGRDLILLGGGLFLIAKATWEIHERIEGHEEGSETRAKSVSYGGVLLQVMLLDMVFSLDSVITAVGMARHVEIMIVAVVVAVIVMMIFAEGVSAFIERHPTIKMLALSFLILIGVLLTAEGLGKHIEKGYVYFAMGFSLAVELLNARVRLKTPGNFTPPPLRPRGSGDAGGER